MNIFHNTRELSYREPFGAVFKDTKVSLKLYAEDDGLSGVKIVVSTKTKDNLSFEMNKIGDALYAYDITPDTAELYHYHFVLEYFDGRVKFYGPAAGRVNGVGCV